MKEVVLPEVTLESVEKAIGSDHPWLILVSLKTYDALHGQLWGGGFGVEAHEFYLQQGLENLILNDSFDIVVEPDVADKTMVLLGVC